MRRCVMIVSLLLLLGALGTVLVAAVPALPPAQITADRFKGNYTARSFAYEGNVKYQSPLYQTLITCARLEANAAKAATTVTATGDVVLSMLSEGQDKEKTSYRIDGRTQRLLYTIANGAPVIRLLKEKGVKPVLTMTDLASKDVTTWTGDVIEYNLQTRELSIEQVETKTEGSAQ